MHWNHPQLIHPYSITFRRREREQKRAAGGDKKTKSKPKAKKPAKKPVAKPKKAPPPKAPPQDSENDEDSDDDVPDTSNDAKLAEELAFGRKAKNRDATGVKAKKKAALDKLRQARQGSIKKDKDEGSELEFESESDESDDDEFKPWQAKTNKKKSRMSAVQEDSDDDSMGERRKGQKAFVEADLSDFIQVTIPRRRLVRWCNEPYFEKAVHNFYVRLAIGRDQRTQRPCYRLCKVVGVQVGNQYQFEPVKPNDPPVSLTSSLSPFLLSLLLLFICNLLTNSNIVIRLKPING